MIDARRYRAHLPSLIESADILKDIKKPDGSAFIFVTDNDVAQSAPLRRDTFLQVVDGPLRNADLDEIEQAIMAVIQRDSSEYMTRYQSLNVTILRNEEYYTESG